MSRNLSLRKAENLLEMADAERRTTCKQMNDPQPRGIARIAGKSESIPRTKYGICGVKVNKYIHNHSYSPPYDTNLQRVRDLTAGLWTGDSRHVKADIEKILRGLI